MSLKHASLILAAAVFTAAGVVPVAMMLAASFRQNGQLTFDHYREVLAASRSWALLGNSILLSSLTTAGSVVVGVPLGILLGKTDLPLRACFTMIFSLPLLLPPYVLTAGWFDVMARAGFGSSIFGLTGCLLVLISCYTPLIALLTMTYLRTVNPKLEEAARLCAGWPRVLRRITLPLVEPGIMLSALLVFLLTLGEFGATSFLRFDVFTVASFTQFSAFYNVGAATAAAVPLALIAFLGLAIERWYLRGKSYQYRWFTGVDSLLIDLGNTRGPLAAVLGFFATVLVALPISALVWRGASLSAFGQAIERAGSSALRSFAYAAVSATLLTLLGLLLGYLVQRQPLATWRFVDGATFFLFTLPGTVLGIGLIALWNRPALTWIYTSPAIVVLAFLAQYAAVSGRIVAAGLSQIPVTLEEAAALAGAGWRARLQSILVPLLRPTITLAWAAGCIFCLRDVSLPLILAPPGRDTLTVRTMTLMANGSPELIAALCLLLICVTAIPVAVIVTVLAAHRGSP